MGAPPVEGRYAHDFVQVKRRGCGGLKDRPSSVTENEEAVYRKLTDKMKAQYG
jgi:hypothetical protein